MKREELVGQALLELERWATYADWECSVPERIRADTLWKVEVYRLALFADDLSWHDATRLLQDSRSRELCGQLYRAVGSISANVAEGYSRGTGKDRARFYEYALGSCRESRDWYYKGRHILGVPTTMHRLELLTSIARLLLKMVPQQRGQTLREAPPDYEGTPAVWETSLSGLQLDIPY